MNLRYDWSPAKRDEWTLGLTVGYSLPSLSEAECQHLAAIAIRIENASSTIRLSLKP